MTEEQVVAAETAAELNPTHLFILYAHDDPDEAPVLVSGHTDEWFTLNGAAGWLYKFQIDTDGKTLINEEFVREVRT